MLSNIGWSFLLLGSEEGVCSLSCWLACPAAGQWGSEKCLAQPFMLPRGGDPGRMASVIFIGRNI